MGSAAFLNEAINQLAEAYLEKKQAELDARIPHDRVTLEKQKVKFTYNSNAIEGNTLTQSETALVLETGITIGGKTLREHLEVIGHKDAINYIETLTQSETEVGEWEIMPSLGPTISTPIFFVNASAKADREQQLIEVYRRENGILKKAITLLKTDQLTSPLLPRFSCEVGPLLG